MVEGPRGHEPTDLGGARVRGAGHRPGGRVPRGRDRPPPSPAGLGDLLPTSGPVREDAEREPGQRRPHPPVRERAVRGGPGDRVTHGRTSTRARDPLPLPVPPVPGPRRGLLVPPGVLQIGFTNLLIIGGFVTFLVIWGARPAMTGGVERGGTSGRL